MGFEPVQDDHKNIKDAGTSLLSLDVRKPNLEEVFLKLTGAPLREGPAEVMAE
jgi:hypothetical protein